MSATTSARDSKRKDSHIVSYKMGVAKIPEGALVSVRSDGYAYNLRSGTSTDVFIGVAHETVDNSVSGAAAGDRSIRVEKKGTYEFAKGTAVIADVGIVHYGADNQTINQTSSNNQAVGKAVGLVDTANLRIMIDGYC